MRSIFSRALWLCLVSLSPLSAYPASGTITAFAPHGKPGMPKNFDWSSLLPGVAETATFGWVAGPLTADDINTPAVTGATALKFRKGLAGPEGVPSFVFETPEEVTAGLLGEQVPPAPPVVRTPNAYSLSGNHGSEAHVSFSGSSTVESKVNMGQRLTLYKATITATASGALGTDLTLARQWRSVATVRDPMWITAGALSAVGVTEADAAWDHLQIVSFSGQVDSPEGRVTMRESYSDATGTLQAMEMTLTQHAAELSFEGLIPDLYLLGDDGVWADELPSPASVDDVLSALAMNRGITLGILLHGVPVPRTLLSGNGDAVARINIDLMVQDGAAAPPIPEPETWIMSVLGLAVLGCRSCKDK